MDKHLLVVGAGHAHMTVMKELERFTAVGHRVTVVNAAPFHYYSGMGPGMLSGIYRPEEIRFNVKRMVEDRGGKFVEDEVVRIEPARKTVLMRSGRTQRYDVASFNTGSFVPVQAPLRSGEGVFTVKPIEKLLDARDRIVASLREKDLSVVVAGAGPAGVEVAGNLRRLVDDNIGRADITLVAGSGVLDDFDRRIQSAAKASFGRRKVKVLEGLRVAGRSEGKVRLSDGSELGCDFIFYALGVRPSTLFADSGLPTGADGGLLVNSRLQSVAHEEIFGGGDCISFQPRPLGKVGVYAVRQNPILLHNLMNALEGGALREFVPQGDYLLAFNMGDGTAIVSWKRILLTGRLGFAVKDFIDRKFMKSFQLSGERRGMQPGS